MSEKATEGPYEVTPDGYRIWSESAQKIVGYTATNNKGRTPEGAANARLLAASWKLRRALARVVRDFSPIEAANILHTDEREALNEARQALKEAGEI